MRIKIKQPTELICRSLSR